MTFLWRTAAASSGNAVVIKLIPVLTIAIGLGIIVSVAAARGNKANEGSVSGNPRMAYTLGGSFFVWASLR